METIIPFGHISIDDFNPKKIIHGNKLEYKYISKMISHKILIDNIMRDELRKRKCCNTKNPTKFIALLRSILKQVCKFSRLVSQEYDSKRIITSSSYKLPHFFVMSQLVFPWVNLMFRNGRPITCEGLE